MKKMYSKFLYALLGLCLPLVAAAQCVYPTNISTVAGSHVNGYSGDGASGTGAKIGSPYCVASDGAGNLYIADYFNHAVRKVNRATGVITTIAGTGLSGYNGDGIPATAAQLSGPASIVLDYAGNVYIADKFNERIRKVNVSTGIITTIAGNGLHGGMPGVPFGNGGPATAAALTFPVSVALDCNGNMYIADIGSQTVRKLTNYGYIFEIAGTHAGGYNGDGIPATAAKLNNPSCVAADCAGNIYIADSYNNRVRKINSSGIISTIAGTGDTAYAGDGGPATAASLCIPWGITLGCGNIFICDYNHNAVRKINASGIMSTFAGSNTRGYTGDGGPATAAAIYLPSSLALDPWNNVYIADYGNLVVRFLGNVPYASRAYVNGTTQNLTVAENGGAAPVSALMAVPAVSGGATATWTVSNTPLHGTLSGFPASAVSVGGIITPSGLTYTPEPGFNGDDEFTVLMNDGTDKASTTVSVKVTPNTAVSNTTATTATTTVMPNPNKGSFICGFYSQDNDPLELIATDLTGRIIYKQQVQPLTGMNTISITLPASIQRPAMVIVSLGNSSVKYPAMKVTVTE